MLKQTILLIEDDEDLGEILIRFIEASGYQTKWLKTGDTVMDYVNNNMPDLILMDVMLPGVDGVTLTNQIRQFSDVPIIMVTAKTDEISRLIGLQTGVDDYVCKPYSGPELVLRIKAILRRVTTNPSPTAVETPVSATSTQSLQLDEAQLKISFGEQQQKLTFVEYSLLNLLISHPNRIYNREQIIELVYDSYREISDRTVDSHIRNVRKKLSLLGLDYEAIESVYGVGYRYIEPAK
ncbi:response regulator [Pseudoalteromonas piratica]|uniref:Transcriptional regulator n=1 Tax=Pseudoalteromonas piratica TaxID=1348114 RepID=A0A0A7EK15_9GAMM|nr:response regulator [Pseudoalteromonas piratica]AIY66893.1 transcriptional regulator [Pseudoalteromonas piratica]